MTYKNLPPGTEDLPELAKELLASGAIEYISEDKIKYKPAPYQKGLRRLRQVMKDVGEKIRRENRELEERLKKEAELAER